MNEDVVRNVIDALKMTGIEASGTELTKWLDNASRSVPAERWPKPDEVQKIAEDAVNQSGFSTEIEITKRNLARWFEIPEEEFRETPPSHLNPEILIRHFVLESQFKEWLEEWGYEVEVGEDMEGIENIEFVPDLYAKRNNLHGKFEIVVCFVCSYPPSQNRVRALFETFESYVREGASFGERDIFFVVTPFSFGRGITQSITLQNNEEKYTVVPLEGNDLATLQSKKTPDKRLPELIEHVERAQLKAENEGFLSQKPISPRQ